MDYFRGFCSSHNWRMKSQGEHLASVFTGGTPLVLIVVARNGAAWNVSGGYGYLTGMNSNGE